MLTLTVTNKTIYRNDFLNINSTWW